MKVCVIRMFFVFLTSLILIGCGNKTAVKPDPVPAASDTSLRTPTKEILVTDGDINMKYTILGQVNHSMEGVSAWSVSSRPQWELTKQMHELLKKEAFTKYGDKVDAIINTNVAGSFKGGVWGAYGAAFGARNSVVNAEGIAVSFENKQEETAAKPEEAAAEPKKSPSKGKRKSWKTQ